MDPRRLQAFSGRFTGMVMPGTSIRVRLVGKTPRPEGTDLHFVVHNAEGQQAISKGYAFIKKEEI